MKTWPLLITEERPEGGNLHENSTMVIVSKKTICFDKKP